MYGYIYKTTNLTNGKVYIGQKKGHFKKSYFGSGLIINRFLKKFGKNSFKVEIICYLSNREQLDEFEKHLIAKYREILGKENLYNIADGGKNTTIGYNSQGNNNGFYGKTHTKETRARISASHKGKKKSDLHRKNISIGKTKKIKDNNIPIKIYINPMFGRKHSDITRQNIKNGLKRRFPNGRKHSEETKQKIREAILLRNKEKLCA